MSSNDSNSMENKPSIVALKDALNATRVPGAWTAAPSEWDQGASILICDSEGEVCAFHPGDNGLSQDDIDRANLIVAAHNALPGLMELYEAVKLKDEAQIKEAMSNLDGGVRAPLPVITSDHGNSDPLLEAAWHH